MSKKKKFIDSDNIADKWIKYLPIHSQRMHIELKDPIENDLLGLIDAKNQYKRFYGWFNF